MTEMEKSMNQIPGTPDEMLKHAMNEYGIGRETAIALMTKSFEAALRVEGEVTETKVDRKLAEMLVTEGKNRAPWFVSFMQAHFRKRLPAWTKLNDEALERGQDPATKMSVTENIIMEMAQDRILLVQLAKEGKTIEEITEASFVRDDERTPEEAYLLIAQQMG